MNIHICCMVLISVVAPAVFGHGYLQDPPSRSSMWRFGFNTPNNYNDNQLFCGGFDHQWNKNNGKCGVCGDPWDGIRENEAGGRYATGTISKRYTEGQIIQVKVRITASHLGYFEFRLCPNNNPSRPVTQQCLDQYVLHQPNGNTRYSEQGSPQVYTVTLKLPAGLTCTQCVLQWKYNAGNNYGKDIYGNTCKGCGKQEQFYGCSDIAIDPSSSGSSLHINTGSNSYQQVQQPSAIGIHNTFLNPPVNSYSACAATVQYRSLYPLADQFCILNCRKGYCPEWYCNNACRQIV